MQTNGEGQRLIVPAMAGLYEPLAVGVRHAVAVRRLAGATASEGDGGSS